MWSVCMLIVVDNEHDVCGNNERCGSASNDNHVSSLTKRGTSGGREHCLCANGCGVASQLLEPRPQHKSFAPLVLSFCSTLTLL